MEINYLAENYVGFHKSRPQNDRITEQTCQVPLKTTSGFCISGQYVISSAQGTILLNKKPTMICPSTVKGGA